MCLNLLLSALYGLTLYCDLVLVNNLHVNIKPIYQLYSILKDREEFPTPNEIAIASGKKKLDRNTKAEYIKKLENTSENIKKASEDQQAQAGISENHPFNFDYLHLMKRLIGTLGSGKIRATSYRVDNRV